jgi:hypothetical protein
MYPTLTMNTPFDPSPIARGWLLEKLSTTKFSDIGRDKTALRIQSMPSLLSQAGRDGS